MPCSLHTEPCSPGIRGQQERLFPTTGKYERPASIIGQRVPSRRTLSDALWFASSVEPERDQDLQQTRKM